MLSIALPKGRLGADVYRIFSKIGLSRDGELEDGRRLVMECADYGVRYLLVKPSDVAIYVEHKAADIGVVGRDVLLETRPEVYELLDLRLGVCKIAVAAPYNWKDDKSVPLKVATKYPNVAREYFSGLNRQIEIIELNGSIELAPILGLSDVIVDIVETGKTLEENNLEVVSVIKNSSARLIANKTSYKFETGAIDSIRDKLREIRGGDENA